jgi:DNA mismatch endonuclease (patch repair protein)
MVGNRSRDTAPELAVRRAVHALGLRYRVAMRPLPQLRRTADLVFSRARVAVFVDGCYWHGCPVHYKEPKLNVAYWGPKIQRNRARDDATTATLESAGWIVLRFWEHDDAVRCALEVEDAVRRRTHRPRSATNGLPAERGCLRPRLVGGVTMDSG